MSQFGYAEEPGENKARADIYAAAPPAPIPPGVRRPRRGGAVVDQHCCVAPRLSCLHEKQPRGVTTYETGLTKEGLVPLAPSPFLFYHHGCE